MTRWGRGFRLHRQIGPSPVSASSRKPRIPGTGGKGHLVLRGRLGVEGNLSDADTVAHVSGERLRSQAARSWGVLGLGAAYRWNQWSLGAEVVSSGLGSDDSDYTASARLLVRF